MKNYYASNFTDWLKLRTELFTSFNTILKMKNENGNNFRKQVNTAKKFHIDHLKNDTSSRFLNKNDKFN